MASFSRMANGKIRAQIRLKYGKDENYLNTMEEATEWAAAREAEMLTTHAKTMSSNSQVRLLKEVAEEYFNSSSFTLKAPSTQKREITASKAPLEALGDFAITVLSYTRISAFFSKRIKQKALRKNGETKDTVISGNAVRLERNFMKNVFEFAQENGYIQINYMLQKYKITPSLKNEIRMTQEQERALYSAVVGLDVFARDNFNKSMVPYISFIRFTGCRPGEAAKIELSWINLKERKISIPRNSSKKRNPRVIPINSHILKSVTEQIKAAEEAGSKYLFWSYGNTPRERRADGSVVRRDKKQQGRVIKPYDYSNGWKTLKKHAGLEGEKLHPHLFRHEFISKLYELTNMSDGQIAALVGDVNLLSLQPYRHVNVVKLTPQLEEHLNETVEQLYSDD